MADFVDNTVKEIDERLGELKQEVDRLQAARDALMSVRSGSSRTASASHSGRRRSGSGRRPGRPRGRRGNTRAGQALELVRERPGITIPQIADAMSIEPNYLYRVMPKLVNDGQVRREGQGWHPAG